MKLRAVKGLTISKSNRHSRNSEVRQLLLLLPPQFPHVLTGGDEIREYQVQGLETLVSVQPYIQPPQGLHVPALVCTPVICQSQLYPELQLSQSGKCVFFCCCSFYFCLSVPAIERGTESQVGMKVKCQLTVSSTNT